MKTGTVIAGVGMMSPAYNSRKMRRKVNSAMRAVGEVADSLTDLISDAF